MKTLRKIVVGALLVLGTGSLIAQPAPEPEPAPAEDSTDAGVTVSGSITAKLSTQEMLSQIATLAVTSENDAQSVLRLQIKARTDKDVIRLNCINDKLLQIKALRNTLDEAKFQFDASVGDAEGQAHQYALVTVSAENIRTLREEAQACAGEDDMFVGPSQVNVTGPDIPDDPSDDPFDDPIEQPGYASPYN
ncbi:MAG TPA: hypothetical protein VFD53_05280 [Ilumatobacter sp.]|nr:hypothetical protein [Ilumatobacter sp.]